jgi:hypothetical protein
VTAWAGLAVFKMEKRQTNMQLYSHLPLIFQNLSHCEEKYNTWPRGANCYCTTFMNCFHRHFQQKPSIEASGGLHLNTSQGVHEYDYFIEISVTNIAQLTTVLTKKVCIAVT